MKHNLLFISLVFACMALFLTPKAIAQTPQKMSYQSVIRNSSNALLANTAVGIKISVLQGSASGTAVYEETQTATTNANGLVSLQIGAGTATTGTFAGINWSAGPYFIKTETDPQGGTTYTITGTQEMLSVPYAMYAAKSGGTFFKPTEDFGFPGSIHNTNAGNVGIGTDLPREKLEVWGGNLKVSQDVIIDGSNLIGGNSIVGQNLEVNGSATIFSITIPSGDPVQGKVLTSDDYGQATWQTPAPSVFEPTIDMPDAIHNTNAGNVGIGTDLPYEKLDVNGNVRVRENLYVAGNIAAINGISVSQNLVVNGDNFTFGNSDVGGTITANSFVKVGGQATEYLMADGSVSSGTTGTQGPQGEPGPIGEKGDKGNNGIDGLQGPEGPVGPQGPAPDLSGYATTTDVTNLQSTVINNQIQSDNLLAQTQYLNNEIYDLESSLHAEVIRATTAEEALDSKIYFRDATDFPGSIYSSNPGNVGIGTDLPSEKLDVAGNLKVRENAMIQGTATANSFVKDGGTSSQFLMADGSVSTGGASGTNAFETTADDATAIHNTNAGNVGIGTDLPSEKLDVNGNLKVRNNATVNGNLNVNGIYFGAGTGITTGNVGIGGGTLSSNIEGTNNIAIGSLALSSNTNGVNNIAIGFVALGQNTTGTSNTAAGSGALGQNTEGSFNTAYAVNALAFNTTGNNNTANGISALVYNTTGSNNTANGTDALFNNTTGSNNTANGKDALIANITGSNNTALGVNANVVSGNLDNATAIGAGATVDVSNKIQLGNTDVTSVNTSGTYTGAGFKTPNGTATEFLMADGSVSTGSTGGSNATVTLAAIGTSSNANGGTIEAGVLNLQPANASFGGVVTTGAQTFAGDKTFTNSLNVDSGTTGGATLEVNGAATNTTAFNAVASRTIDFTKSNLAYTTASAGAFTLSGMKDGGTYTLAVQGMTAGTSSFSQTGFAFKSISNGATTANKDTIYTFLVLGYVVYFSMTTGF